MADDITYDLDDLKATNDTPLQVEDVVSEDIENVPVYKFNKKVVDEEIQSRLSKIDKYYNTFPELKQKLKKPRNLASKTIEQLDTFISDLDKGLGSDANIDMLKIAYGTTLSLVETVGMRRGYKLAGMADKCCQSEFIDRQLKRLEIKYLSDMDYCDSPEAMLVLATVGIAYSTHQINTKRGKVGEHLDDVPKNPDLESLVDDL